jgi:hypothetical protein
VLPFIEFELASACRGALGDTIPLNQQVLPEEYNLELGTWDLRRIILAAIYGGLPWGNDAC